MMIFLRSKRSEITPAKRVKTNHGNLDANPTIAISKGERVTADASHGYATLVMPSPKLDIADADQRRQYFEPNLPTEFIFLVIYCFCTISE